MEAIFVANYVVPILDRTIKKKKENKTQKSCIEHLRIYVMKLLTCCKTCSDFFLTVVVLLLGLLGLS